MYHSIQDNFFHNWLMGQAIIKTSLLDENFQHASDRRIKLLLYGVAIFPNQIQLGKGKLFKAIKHIRHQLHKSFELRTIKTQFSSDVFFFFGNSVL